MKQGWIEHYIYKNEDGVDVVSPEKPTDGREFITVHEYISRSDIEYFEKFMKSMPPGPAFVLDEEYLQKQIKRLIERKQ